MRNNKVFISFLVICLLILTACSTNNGDTDAQISLVQEAGEKSSQLKNGEFSYLRIVENEDEKHSQTTLGTFSVQDDYVDWHTKLILSESDSNSKTINETIQKDKIQYNRFGIINEDQVLIDEPEWNIVQEDVTDYPNALLSLMNIELNKEEIEKVEVTEESDVTIYAFTYNDAYLASLKQGNITKIQEQLENAEKENADSNIISSLENSLLYNESIDFESIKVILAVNKEGILIRKDLESVFANDAVQTIKMTERVEIEKYNVTDLEIEL